MLEAARAEAERMRRSPQDWAQVAYDPGPDGDRNEVARARVLWGLQYDRRPGDLELVRFLAGQEARSRREDDGQGLGEPAELAGFLLAGYRRVTDVWRQWEIKRANFDTWCGYDVQYLLTAGVQATLEHVRGSDRPERDELLQRLLEEDLTDGDVAAWWDGKQSWFPADPAAEEPLNWIERAHFAGDLATVRRLLDAWAEGRPRDADTVSQLAMRLADLGDFAGAAAARRELLAYTRTDWDAASGWTQVAGLERRAGDHEAAWAALLRCREILAGMSGWTEAGLGRSLVEEMFLLAGTAEIGPARIAFAEADRLAADVPRLAPVVLAAAAAAADRVGEPDRARFYRGRG